MRVLLTGAAGQLAHDLRAVLAEEDVVALPRGELDITDSAAVAAAVEWHQPNCILNTAAYNRVDDSEDHPDAAFAANALGVYHLARVAAAAGAVLVHFSTDYVFDGAKGSPYTEQDPPHPLSVYALSKRVGEQMVERYAGKYFLLRTCGLYGVAGNQSKGGNFVERMLRLAGEGRPLRVVDDQVLTPTNTRELAERLLPLLRTERYGLYHMTNTGQCSWYEFAREIFRLAGISPALEPVSSATFAARARRPSYSVLDNAAYRAAGFPDFRPWQEALADYLKRRQV